MSFEFTAAGALWLLALLPFAWAGTWFGRTNYNTRQRIWQTAVRSLLLAVLACALARPVMSSGSSRLAVVYVVDVSHSIASRAIRDAASKIDALNAAAKPELSRILVFGAAIDAVPDTAALRKIADVEPGAGGDALHRDGSDLELALDRARAELQPGFSMHVILLSDGRPTTGDPRAAVTRLAAASIPVSTAPLVVRDLGDSWVDAMEFPEYMPSGATVPVRVTLGSQRAANATIELRDGAEVLAVSRASLQPGLTILTIDVAFPTPGAREIEARLTASGDPLPVNNQLAVEAVVQAPARVLYVEGVPASAAYLQSALVKGGFDVTVKPPTAMPSTLEDLEPWDAVVLSDLPRVSISDASMAALATWIEREGGGVLFAGGDAVFGESPDGAPTGYRHTELERLMPVTFERKDQPEVALIIVLDHSWSMEGSVMEICKAAAQAAVAVMTDKQTIGILSFNDQFKWDVTPRLVGKNREAITKTIGGIEANGYTLIYPAVEQAYLAMQKLNARAKHVILLSDGRSYPDDYKGLVEKMVKAKITVSTVAVGRAADTELLTNIANWGHGRGYVVSDAKDVPEIFVKETKEASVPAFEEGTDITPVVKTRAFLEDVDLSRMPALRGRTGMTAKDAATEVLVTSDDNPLLTFWPIGAGRTAAFAPDVKDRWAGNWIHWNSYGPFFSATVRAVLRQRSPELQLSATTTSVRGGRRTVAVVVEARDRHGDYRDLLRPVLHVRAGDGRTGDVTVHQVAPGRYETSVTTDAGVPVTLAVTAPEVASTASRLIVPDVQAEYRFRSPDLALLRGIATATNGVFDPSAEDLRRTASTSQSVRRALWPFLVLLALGLWFVDIVFRRIRMGTTDAA